MEQSKDGRYFEYGEKEIEYLKKKDKKLGGLIDRIGMLYPKVTADLFAALVDSVISQQISSKAASSIHNRLMEMTEITAEKIDSMEAAEIQKCGVSFRKAEYIKSIAKAVVSKEIDVGGLRCMSDAAIIGELVKLKGVGVWTAEMMLIFSFERTDVISYGDLGIRRNMMALYGLKALSKEKFARYAKRYSPYASVASFYLWAMTD